MTGFRIQPAIDQIYNYIDNYEQRGYYQNRSHNYRQIQGV